MTTETGTTDNRRHWTPIDANGAYRWAFDEVTNEPYIDGLVLYGPVDSARLKALKLRAAGRAGSCHYVDPDAVLSPARISELLMHDEAQDKRPAYAEGSPVEWPTGAQGRAINLYTGDGTKLLPPWPSWVSKAGSGMPTATWFEQTAAMFRELQLLYPQATTAKFADLADVPFTTAVRWVRECRSRGLLPKSSKQLGKAKGKRA